MIQIRSALIAILLLPGLTAAGDKVNALKHLPPPNLSTILAGNDPAALAGSLRGYLVNNLPKTLYEDNPGWGQTKRVHKIDWQGQGFFKKPVPVDKDKNDGTWRKIRATAENLPDNLVLDIRDLRNNEPGRLTFDVFLAFDAKLHIEQQKWESGLRLLSTSARARMRVKVNCRCELNAKLENNGSILPDAVFRLRVVWAQLGYENLVVEHIAGVGGEAARLLGDGIKGSLKQWHPSLEGELLAKANAAIVKAGDSKEVRLSMSKLFRKPVKPAGG